ncbi:MAG: PAS domain-containing protein [Alphaproteobacteria bacterium]|nr:PAS domain-containing protein [Alphaproteobacteria bacterium]
MEQRLNDRLSNYWNRLCKDGRIPAIESFNSGAMADIWQQCAKISVTEAGTRTYYFEFMGESLAKVLGKSMSGERVIANMLTSPKFKLIHHLDSLVAKTQPTTEEGQFVNEKSKVVKYRSIILPFGKDNEHITHFILGVSWREF